MFVIFHPGLVESTWRMKLDPMKPQPPVTTKCMRAPEKKTCKS